MSKYDSDADADATMILLVRWTWACIINDEWKLVYFVKEQDQYQQDKSTVLIASFSQSGYSLRLD